MYTKFGSIYVVSDMGDLPVAELKLADQIILMAANKNKHRAPYQTNVMVLVEIKNNIYTFGGHQTTVSYDSEEIYDEHEEYIGEKITYADYDNRNFTVGYLLMNGRLLPIADDIFKYSHHSRSIKSEDSTDGKICRAIKDTRWIKSDFIRAEGLHHNYLSIPLQNQCNLVFQTSVKIDVNKLTWEVYSHVKIFNDDQVIVIDGAGERLMQNILEHYTDGSGLSTKQNSNVKEFTEINSALRFNMEDYIDGNKTAYYKLRQLFLYEIAPLDITKFFTPVYRNEELQVEVYAEFGKPLFCHEGKEKPYYSLDENSPLFREYRKGKAIVAFMVLGQNGISPYDGKLYSDGVLKEISTKQYFRCRDGICHRTDGYWQKEYYYVNLDGYYVPCEDDETDLINSIKNQWEVQKILTGTMEA